MAITARGAFPTQSRLVNGAQDGQRRPHILAKCCKCDTEGAIVIAKHSGTVPAEAGQKMFRREGWEMGSSRSKDLCPTCVKAKRGAGDHKVTPMTHAAPRPQPTPHLPTPSAPALPDRTPGHHAPTAMAAALEKAVAQTVGHKPTTQEIVATVSVDRPALAGFERRQARVPVLPPVAAKPALIPPPAPEPKPVSAKKPAKNKTLAKGVKRGWANMDPVARAARVAHNNEMRMRAQAKRLGVPYETYMVQVEARRAADAARAEATAQRKAQKESRQMQASIAQIITLAEKIGRPLSVSAQRGLQSLEGETPEAHTTRLAEVRAHLDKLAAGEPAPVIEPTEAPRTSRAIQRRIASILGNASRWKRVLTAEQIADLQPRAGETEDQTIERLKAFSASGSKKAVPVKKAKTTANTAPSVRDGSMARLSGDFIESVTRPGRYADGGNLYLVVHQSGSKSWTFIYFIKAKRREMGLGGYRHVNTAQARARGAIGRDLLARGLDPKDHSDQMLTPKTIPAALEQPQPPAAPTVAQETKPMSTAQPPRTCPPEQTKRIRIQLLDHYDLEKERYLDDLSDARLAEKLDVPAAWVTNLRSAMGIGEDVNEASFVNKAKIDEMERSLDAAEKTELALIEEVAAFRQKVEESIRQQVADLRTSALRGAEAFQTDINKRLDALKQEREGMKGEIAKLKMGSRR